MLYIGVCALCGFLVIAEDILAFKQEIATHFDKSHGSDFGAFVSHIPLKEFEQISIRRVRNKQEIAMVKQSINNPKTWHTFRNSNRNALARINPFFLKQLWRGVKAFM